MNLYRIIIFIYLDIFALLSRVIQQWIITLITGTSPSKNATSALNMFPLSRSINDHGKRLKIRLNRPTICRTEHQRDGIRTSTTNSGGLQS